MKIALRGALIASLLALTVFGVVEIATAGVWNAVVTGQLAIATTGTAVNLPSNALVNGIVVTANISNAATIYVGGSGVTNTGGGTGNGKPLAPGQSDGYAISNTNILWINGTAGDWVSFSGN